MKLRTVLLPAALMASLAFVATDSANAAPLASSSTSKALFGPRIGVGIGVRVPIGHRRGIRRAHTSGYYRTVVERVWHPPEFIGYDAHGAPIYSPGHYDMVERQVWVPHRRRVIRRPRGVVHVGFGGVWGH